MTRGENWVIVHGADREASSLDDAHVLSRVLDRAMHIVPASRVLVAVTERTRDAWAEVLNVLPASNRIEVPFERGAPASILLAFLHVFRSDPAARVVVMPANHLVENEDTLIECIMHALAATPGRDNRAALIRDTMIFAANTSAMLRLYDHALPGILRSFLSHFRGPGAWSPELVERLCRFLPRVELARDLLEPSQEIFRVLPIGPCGYVHLEIELEQQELEMEMEMELEDTELERLAS